MYESINKISLFIVIITVALWVLYTTRPWRHVHTTSSKIFLRNMLNVYHFKMGILLGRLEGENETSSAISSLSAAVMYRMYIVRTIRTRSLITKLSDPDRIVAKCVARNLVREFGLHKDHARYSDVLQLLELDRTGFWTCSHTPDVFQNEEENRERFDAPPCRSCDPRSTTHPSLKLEDFLNGNVIAVRAPDDSLSN